MHNNKIVYLHPRECFLERKKKSFSQKVDFTRLDQPTQRPYAAVAVVVVVVVLVLKTLVVSVVMVK